MNQKIAAALFVMGSGLAISSSTQVGHATSELPQMAGPVLRPQLNTDQLVAGPVLRPQLNIDQLVAGPVLRPQLSTDQLVAGPVLRPQIVDSRVA